MIQLNKHNFDSHIEKGLSIVDFSAESWCGPCKMLAPVLEKLSNDMKHLKFSKVDVDENTDIAQVLGIMSVPTMVIFKDGEEIGRISGFHPAEVLKQKISEILE